MAKHRKPTQGKPNWQGFAQAEISVLPGFRGIRKSEARPLGELFAKLEHQYGCLNLQAKMAAIAFARRNPRHPLHRQLPWNANKALLELQFIKLDYLCRAIVWKTVEMKQPERIMRGNSTFGGVQAGQTSMIKIAQNQQATIQLIAYAYNQMISWRNQHAWMHTYAYNEFPRIKNRMQKHIVGQFLKAIDVLR